MISSSFPWCQESLFIILRLQCLIIAEAEVSKGARKVSSTECPRPSQEREEN